MLHFCFVIAQVTGTVTVSVTDYNDNTPSCDVKSGAYNPSESEYMWTGMDQCLTYN